MQDDEARREKAARWADEALLRELAELLERDDPVPEDARAGARPKPGARRGDDEDPPSGDGE